jgi:uncharacterized delta-60 repeat protein
MNRIRNFLVLALFLASLAPATTLAQPGTLDPSFGDGGAALFGPVTGGGAAAFQPDGMIVVAGGIGYGTGDVDAALWRFYPDGTPDPSFGTGGAITLDLGGPGDEFLDVEVLPSGAILAGGGKFTGDGSSAAQGAVVARFLPDGTLDPAFGSGGLVMEPNVAGAPDAYTSLDVRPDGRIVAGGKRGEFSDACYAVQYLEDGRRDGAFGTAGVALVIPPGEIAALCFEGALLPDGRYVFGGNPYSYEFFAARLLEDGTPDPAFGGDGYAITSGLGGWFTMVTEAMPDGGATVLGVDSLGAVTLVRFGPDGALDPSFGAGGVAHCPDLGPLHPLGSVQQPDGKVAFAGWSPTDSRLYLARILPDGALDPAFGSGGVARLDLGQPSTGYDYGYELALQPDGRLVLVGGADVGAPSESGLAARFVDDHAVVVSAAPVSPPVEVEPGGTFAFTATLANVTDQPKTIQAWTAVTGAVAREPVLGPRTVTLPPGATLSRTLTQEVPDNAPVGPYVYHVRAGDFPSGVVASAAFPVMVYRPEVAPVLENGTSDWAGRGWDEGKAPTVSAPAGLPHGYARSEASPRRTAARTTFRPTLRPGTLAASRSRPGRASVAPATPGAPATGGSPAALALHAAQPNPFVTETVLGYDLPAAGPVRLAVYDVLGREVTVLVDGYAEAGVYSATFDARGLAAGTYLYRLTAGDDVRVGRMTLAY